MLVGLSFFEGLTTLAFRRGGIDHPFDYVDYIQTRADQGTKFTRSFVDLPFFWNGTAGVFVHQNADLLYEKLGDSWKFGTISQTFKDRLDTVALIMRKNKMQWQLTGATQGPDYNCPFFTKMGYPASHKEYYYRADFPDRPLAWARFQQYFADIGTLTDPYKQRFKHLEFYNEHGGGSIIDELKGIGPATRSTNKHIRFQLSFPNPLYLPNSEWPDVGDYLGWIKKLQNGHAGAPRIEKFSFHGMYTANGVKKLAAILKQGGIALNTIRLSTDGATPGFGHTEESHNGHYKRRMEWDKSVSNFKSVTTAHEEMIQAAGDAGFDVFDVQDTIKWSEDLNYTKNTNKEWAERVVTR